MDSNHRPLPCQGSALTRLSYGPADCSDFIVLVDPECSKRPAFDRQLHRNHADQLRAAQTHGKMRCRSSTSLEIESLKIRKKTNQHEFIGCPQVQSLQSVI